MESNRILPSELVAKRLDAEYYGKRYRHVSKLVNQCGSVVTLEDVRSANTPIRRGIDMPKFVKNSKSPVLVTIASFEEPGINFQSLQRIDTKQHNTFSGSRLEAGDLLVAMGGYAGCAAICPADTPQANIGRHTARIVVDPRKANKYYLWAFIRSNLGTVQFEREITGSVQAGINLEDLRQILIPAPSKLVQTYIGDKVRLAERLRARSRKLESRIKAQFSFLSADLKPRRKSWRVYGDRVESYRLNPTHYDVVVLDMLERARAKIDLVPLGSLFGSRSISGGATPKGADYPETGVFFVRVQNVKPLRLDLSDAVYLAPAQDEELKRSRCEAGEIILTITGYPGIAAIVLEDDLPVNINQHSVRFDVHLGWESEYIAATLNTTFLKMQVNRLAIGGTRDALDYTSVSNLLIPVFPEATRQAIARDVAISNCAIRSAERLTIAAKLLVEALIEGKVTEDELKTAQQALQRGDREPDQIILSRLTRKGIDIKGEPPLFPNLDALYDAINQVTTNNEEQL